MSGMCSMPTDTRCHHSQHTTTLKLHERVGKTEKHQQWTGFQINREAGTIMVARQWSCGIHGEGGTRMSDVSPSLEKPFVVPSEARP